MYQNMSTLSELKHKQQLIQQQITDLKGEMDSFNESMCKEVADGVERYPIQIRGRRAPIKPDEEQPDESDALKLLPPPLLPHKIVEEPQPPPPQADGLGQFAIKEASPEERDKASPEPAEDPFASLSLTVQGRIIPCIPCDNKSPSPSEPPP